MVRAGWGSGDGWWGSVGGMVIVLGNGDETV